MIQLISSCRPTDYNSCISCTMTPVLHTSRYLPTCEFLSACCSLRSALFSELFFRGRTPRPSSCWCSVRAVTETNRTLQTEMWNMLDLDISTENVNTLFLLTRFNICRFSSCFCIWSYVVMFVLCVSPLNSSCCNSQSEADISAATGLKQQRRKISEVGVKYD